jgi:parallel beta-helix repeat protein
MKNMTPSPQKISHSDPSATLKPKRKRIAGLAFALLFLALSAPMGWSADYFVDPATGSMTNPGTTTSPWSTLEAVFTANKTFLPGDVIHLRSGYHGLPQVKGNNTGPVTIQPDTGASPQLRRMIVKTASNWVIKGLDICPEYAGAGLYEPGRNLVEIQSTCSFITLENNTLKHSLTVAGWSQTDWETRLGNGISVAGPNCHIVGNALENVNFGISVSKTAPFAVVSGNTITAFAGDGMRGLADDGLFENNLLQDSYVNNSNHDDFFQSWSADASGAVGKGTVYRITLRGNIFISRRDPNQPLYAPPQGIGCFDGMFEDWVIENNLIVSQTYHGISLYGAINCRIVNNTVVENPVDVPSAVRPWIRLDKHKDVGGVPWPVLPTGNIVRNNLTSSAVFLFAGSGVAGNNLNSTLYTTYFNDYTNFDFSLKASAPAVDTGSSIDTPSTDIIGNPRTIPYDIGAYEYQGLPVAYEGFTYAPTLNVSAAPDSPDDWGLLGNTWTGTNDIIAPGLAYPGLPTLGNALRFFSNVGSVRNIDMSAFPAGYTVVDSDSVTRLGVAGTTLWLQFLMRVEATDPAATLTSGLNLNGAASGGITKLRIGDVGTSPNWSVSRYSTVGSSGTPIVTGETVLVVARISFVAGTNNDEVDLYINPPLTFAPPATPSATIRNVDVGRFDRLEIKGNRTSVIDEISIATEWNKL